MKVYSDKFHATSAACHKSLRDQQWARFSNPEMAAVLQIFRPKNPIAWYTTCPVDPSRREMEGGRLTEK
jgi:hypothetical protein